MIRYARFDTPLGPLFAIAEGEALVGIHFEGARHAPPRAGSWIEDPDAAPLAQCRRQIEDYFAGRRQAFDLPLAAVGTAFQQSVWKAISGVPFAGTLSYAELAARAGAKGAARAAGAATGRNPFTIVVPCHRIVGSGGELTGYAGGLERKARLLALERARP